MQTDSHILDDVARVATGAMGAASGLKGELDAMVKRRLEGILAQMDLVPRGRVRRGQGDGGARKKRERGAGRARRTTGSAAGCG